MTQNSSREIDNLATNILQETFVLGVSLNLLSYAFISWFGFLQYLKFNFLQYFN